MPRSWLDSVPVCTDVYVYLADLLCEDCAHEIANKLDKKKVIDDGDSDTYPQGPHGDGGGESDSFHFCGSGPRCINAVEIDQRKIGCPLGNPLTRDGAIRLREQVVEDLLSPTIFKRLLGRLLRRVWSDYTGGDYSSSVVRLDVSPAKLPTSLVNAVKNHYGVESGIFNLKDDPIIDAFVLADPDHVYLVARWRDVDLLRIAVDDEGNFNEVDVATIPREAAEGYDAERLLRDADEDMAWD
jgi:hypothetical protein